MLLGLGDLGGIFFPNVSDLVLVLFFNSDPSLLFVGVLGSFILELISQCFLVLQQFLYHIGVLVEHQS